MVFNKESDILELEVVRVAVLREWNLKSKPKLNLLPLIQLVLEKWEFGRKQQIRFRSSSM